jgi:hypothetical protein
VPYPPNTWDLSARDGFVHGLSVQPEKRGEFVDGQDRRQAFCPATVTRLFFGTVRPRSTSGVVRHVNLLGRVMARALVDRADKLPRSARETRLADPEL